MKNTFESDPLSPDDPRLTAHALGELDESESAAVKARIAEDPVLAEAVSNIKQSASLLAEALATEPAIEIADPKPFQMPGSYRSRKRARERKRLLGRNSAWWAAAGAIAACILLFVTVSRLDTRWEGREEAGLASDTPSLADLAIPPVINTKDNQHGAEGDRINTGSRSYEILRHALIAERRLPPPEEVQTEELINNFSYEYDPPDPDSGVPFAVHTDATLAPWAPAHQLVRVGIQGKRLPDEHGVNPSTTIATDVEIEVEFSPLLVQSYRFIGYENFLLPEEGSTIVRGHVDKAESDYTITAIYEVAPAGAPPHSWSSVDQGGNQNRLQSHPGLHAAASNPRDLLTVKIQYSEPGSEESQLLKFPFNAAAAPFAQSSNDFKFAAAVAGFGMILSDVSFRGPMTLDNVLNWATEGMGADEDGKRADFVELVLAAKKLN